MFKSKFGFVEYTLEMFNKIIKYMHPNAKLTLKEQAKSKYSDLFVKAAKTDRSFNKLYIHLITKQYSDLQILYAFFKELNKLNFTKTRHQLFKIAEKKLFRILKINKITDPLINNIISQRIYQNLIQVSKFSFTNCQEDDNFIPYEKQINSVKQIINNLILKIQDQEKLLGLNNSTNKQKLLIYKLIQDHKKKLYYFILKTDLWKKQQTLYQEQEFNFTYIQQQFHKFPNEKYDLISSDNKKLDPYKTKETLNKPIYHLENLNQHNVFNNVVKNKFQLQ